MTQHTATLQHPPVKKRAAKTDKVSIAGHSDCIIRFSAKLVSAELGTTSLNCAESLCLIIHIHFYFPTLIVVINLFAVPELDGQSTQIDENVT